MRSKIIYSSNCINNRSYFAFLKDFSIKKKKKIREADLLLFIQSICEFLKINHDLAFCIESSLHFVRKDMRSCVEDVILRLNKGEKFSSTLTTARIFPNYAINLVKSGERNKSFREMFEMLRDFIQWNIEQKKKMRMALMYPLFTFFVFTGIIFLFSVYIIPSIFGLLETINQGANSNYLFFSWFLFGLKSLIALVFLFLISMFFINIFNKSLFEKILFSSPIFGNFFKYKAIYMTSYYIHSSLNNNISLLESLEIAIDSSNGITKETLLQMKDGITKGVKINESLKKFRFIPLVVRQIIKTGEDSGNLANSFYLIKQMFFAKYRALVDKFINVFPVVLVMFTSIMMIGFVLLVFMPLYNFSS